MFQGNLWSFQNQDYFWREITARLRRQKKSSTCKSVTSCTTTGKKAGVISTWATFLWHLLGKPSVVVHGWLGQSTTQLCKGLSKREWDTYTPDFYKSTLHFVIISWQQRGSPVPFPLRPSHRIYSPGFQEGSALSSCPWSCWVWSISENPVKILGMVTRLFWKI